MSVLYKAIKTVNENGRVCFGVEMSRRYSDVFETQKDAEQFADLCNSCELSELHFDDAVYDYLNR